MSAEHRKPLAAFVLLAFVAAVVVGVQRADAQTGFLASVMGSTTRVQGVLPELSAASGLSEQELRRLGPAFGAVLVREQQRSERSEASSVPPLDERAETTSSPGIPARSSREHASRGIAVRGLRHGLSVAREALGHGRTPRTDPLSGSLRSGARVRGDLGTSRRADQSSGRDSRGAADGSAHGHSHRAGQAHGHHRRAAHPGGGRLRHGAAGAHGWQR